MMISAVLETPDETRVAITPHTAKNFLQSGFQVAIEKNAGLASHFNDEQYASIGVLIDSKKNLLKQTNILLCVNEPEPKKLPGLSADSLIIGPIDKDPDSPLVQWCLKNNYSLLSMNCIPRITRAQSMDSLSSQANLAGYRAIIEAVNQFQRVVPMMMTAAGMIQPAKVLVLGAGVAGLQAIATAKRLGAIVYAFDVRRAAKEQIESLGAEFIEVSDDADLETSGGYASETSDEYKKLQAELIDRYAKMADIVITTALIPGSKAPLLLTKTTVEQMKPGSVIVDLATSRGGNCEVSKPDEVILYKEVTVVGFTQIARQVPATASELYANNLLHLITLLTGNSSQLHFNPDDEIIRQALLCYQGGYLPFQAAKENTHA